MNPADSPPSPPRSGLLTAFAWTVIAVSALGIPISVLSGLMLIAGSDGTQNAEPLGALAVVCGPTLTLVAGIGMLLRRRWAWWIMVIVLGAILISNVWTMIAVETGPSHYVSPGGVPTTVLKSGGLYLSPIVITSGLSLALLLTRRIRTECGGVKPPPPFTAEKARPVARDVGRGWRVGHTGRDQMYYEEKRDGGWQRIEISGEMLTGRAHHVICFRSHEHWLEYPDWARHRREEIIARIKSEFREPDYEYHEPATTSGVPTPTAMPLSVPSPTTDPFRRPAKRSVQGTGALMFVIVIFVALGGAMGWLVSSGLRSGQTHFPAKHVSRIRVVSQADEPAMFWVAIGLYSTIGVASTGFAAWLGTERSRLRRHG